MIGIVPASVFHARYRPRTNKFRYNAPYLLVSLKDFSRRRFGLFSIEGRNLFSIRGRDYGDGENPNVWIMDILRQWNVFQPDGEILLMTMPRILGYAFNPVNFWFCKDKHGALRAVVSEVNNTFGERHCYICFHEDRRAIQHTDILSAQKIFHVSPFMDMAGAYNFRFSLAENRVSIFIELTKDGHRLLLTSVSGAVQEFASARILRLLLKNPFLPFKIIVLIHYQAIKLFLKGIRHFAKPPPPSQMISH